MKSKSFQIGEQVYLPELRQFGIVEELTASGLVRSVRINTVSGEEVINTINMIVLIANVVHTGLLPVLKALFIEIKSWFS